MGHARALLALSGRAQTEAATQVAAKAPSVRETEALVRRLAVSPRRRWRRPWAGPGRAPAAVPISPDRLGAVALQQGAGGKGD